MKKLFTLGVVAAMAMSAGAANYQVYKNGVLADGLTQYTWLNCDYSYTAENPTDADSQTFKVYPQANGEANFCMGIFAPSEDITGPLHKATLNFSYYAKGTFNCTIRLTAGVEGNYKFTVNDDNTGSWQNMSLSVADVYPTIASKWENGNDGYVFSLVVGEYSDGAEIYFDNIYYSDIDESWSSETLEPVAAPTTMPAAPTQDAENVMSVFSSYYDSATTFNIGSWGQKTQPTVISVDGKDVYYFANFNYLGFADMTLDLSDMDYMHVDMWTPDAVSFRFTPIGAGEKLWPADNIVLNEWNSYDVPLKYFSGDVNLANVYQIKFDEDPQVYDNIYVTNVYFWKDTNKEENGEDNNGEDNNGEDNSGSDDNSGSTGAGAVFTGSLSGTTTQDALGTTPETKYSYVLDYTITYNEDKTLTFNGQYNWANGTPQGGESFAYFIVSGGSPDEYRTSYAPANVTTTQTFEEGQVLTLKLKWPVALGAVDPEFTYTVGSSNVASGVASVAVESNSEAVYYNLQGVRVANPQNGLYIRVKDGKSVKVAL